MGVQARPPAECFRVDESGTPATCTKVAGEWVVSYDDGSVVVEEGFGAADTAVPAGFAVFFVLALLGGVAFTLWKVATARRMARDAGMSESDATAMTLLSDDGFEATYLASNVRGRPAAPAGGPVPGGSASERLTELRGLLDRGLVTQDEHDAARRRILDDL